MKSIEFIAEIGGNFTTPSEGIKLVDAAKKSGATSVKLQTYKADTVASSTDAVLDMENTGVVSQHQLFQKFELEENVHREVFDHAKLIGLKFLSTPSHKTDVDLLEKFDVSAYKIGSDDATNLPFLRYVAKTFKPVILSTGMCTMSEVHEAVDALLGAGCADISILHAVTSYPTHHQDVNLKAMVTLKKHFPDFKIGYSCHTLTPLACFSAIVLGAEIVEKHFTLDKNADGPDHMLSATPEEFQWIVDSAREFYIFSGNGVKRPAKSESITRINNRKSIVVTEDVSVGAIIRREMIDVKRPGTGIEPKYFDLVIGRKLATELRADSVLRWDHFG